MKYLRTYWFGCFVIDKSNIIDKELFENDVTTIKKNIEAIREQKILDEEKQLIEKYDDIVVLDDRLCSIAPFYQNQEKMKPLSIDCFNYGYESSLLHQVLHNLTKCWITKDLAHPDYQIIQMISALDDLQQTENLLTERFHNWNLFPMEKEDIDSFQHLIQKVDDEILFLRKRIQQKMVVLTPNTSHIIGPFLAARLLALAGSLKKLACLPASSIQLLGAEKALFRFKKEGGKPPKHGVIYQHPLICSAPKKKRGKISRLLALTISLSIKADVFTHRDMAKILESRLKEKISLIGQDKT